MERPFSYKAMVETLYKTLQQPSRFQKWRSTGWGHKQICFLPYSHRNTFPQCQQSHFIPISAALPGWRGSKIFHNEGKILPTGAIKNVWFTDAPWEWTPPRNSIKRQILFWNWNRNATYISEGWEKLNGWERSERISLKRYLKPVWKNAGRITRSSGSIQVNWVLYFPNLNLEQN